MKSKEFWDKKAEDFPRYKSGDEFTQKIINILKDKKLLNRKTSMLDIGCGTGVYTIALAKEVQEVVALDISKNMLEILENDALTNNIETVESTWSDFKKKQKFDLIFASLSAAFSEKEDYEKVLQYSKGAVCFINFVDYKGSNIEDLVEEKLGIEKKAFNELTVLKEWLKEKEIDYKSIPLTNTHSDLIDLHSAVRRVQEILDFSKSNIELQEEEIIDLLQPLMNGAKVEHTLNMKLELTYWKS